MVRINNDTPVSALQEVKVGTMVTDTFSKTGIVESIDINDDGYHKIYQFHLVTGRTIKISK